MRLVKHNSVDLRPDHRQAGFTMVELMVAMVLGLMVVLVVTQFMLTSNQTYRATREHARVHETVRFALDEISRHVRMAGFSEQGEKPNFFYRGPCSIGIGSTNCTVDDNDGDQIAVWLNPTDDNSGGFTDSEDSDGLAEDCTGSTGAGSAGEISTTSFHQLANVIFIGDVDGDQIFSLYCQGYNISIGAEVSDPLPLVDGVDNLQIQYAQSDSTGTRYLPASAVTDWASIVAVKINVLASTGDIEGTAEAVSRTYRMLDRGDVPFSDDYNRQVFSTTVRINNAAL